ncbi:hypothetical protein V6N13_093574 [Hibiscus sabdariffa]
MDTHSSGEELHIKTRKPYTITKQRERWTEEEHNRFLEALKLYGRAWQRIEEHIGTKTAVQIRSHAQKFFTKLEKEALAKGVPIAQALDIEIPPPRPKRKPSNPYPRKTGAATTVQEGAKAGNSETPISSLHCKQVLDLEKEPLPERPNGDEKATNLKENQDEGFSEVFTLLHGANCSSASSMNKNFIPTSAALINSCTFREFVTSLTETIHGNGTSRASNLENSCTSYQKSAQDQRRDDIDGVICPDEMQDTQNYPQNVAVHVLDGSLKTCAQNPSRDMSFQDSAFHPMGNVHGPNLFTNPAASATTEHQNNVPRSTHQALPPFHTPFMHICPNQEDHRSFLHASSTFSSLIVSTLLQNPAAHAAASFAATFWPYANVGSSGNTPTSGPGGFPSRQMNSTPSMAAVAAATVAAATAWWAAHGLIPVCAPLHPGFTCAPASTAAVTPMENGQAPAAKTEQKDKTDQAPAMLDGQPDLEYSEALQGRHSESKSPTSSSSDCEERGDAKVNTGVKATDDEKAAKLIEPQDENKSKNRKQVDRSCCGSNTPSSSEVETDVLEKHEKDKEDSKGADANHPQVECNRRSRSNSSLSDSWKEVSEEGRLAFQALFSREVLPQSFSPPHDGKNKEQQKENIGEDEKNPVEEDEETSTLDLNSKTLGSCSGHQEVEKTALSRGEKNTAEEGLLRIGLGNSKLKAGRTGFKPYKRCSVEAKENRVMNTGSHGEEKADSDLLIAGNYEVSDEFPVNPFFMRDRCFQCSHPPWLYLELSRQTKDNGYAAEVLSMDTYSSGEELLIKTRKPYTITKQRERWTEEEHNRFLEALKLYGRAWQRIEEHIGTKTAVQIRSHAQKFFSKLEKEALAKGVPISQALDIEIPPPRPKRKPSNPYPRKTGVANTVQEGAKDGKSEMQISSLRCKQVLDLEKEPLPERPNGDEKATNLKENQDESCSEVFTRPHEANCTSVSSMNKNFIPTSAAHINSCVFREFVPLLKETIHDNGTSKASNLENSCTSYQKPAQVQRKDGLDGVLCADEMQDSVFNRMGDVHGPNLFTNPAASATTEHQNNAPGSTHQNPAAHAAASFAATFWPYANVESSGDSPPSGPDGFPSGQMNSAPSMAAIAAATVAAATAWWAAHGLLPVCGPLHPGFTCAPASTAAVPPMENGQAPTATMEQNDKADQALSMQDEQLDPKYSEGLQGQHSPSKSPTSSSSDCEERGDAKVNTGVKATDAEKAAKVTEPQDANKTNNKKQVDRSSCGSNTASSSDVETDVLEKHDKDKEDSKGADANHAQVECNRRSRSSSNTSDSWKGVSEEGRQAFQALFSREVLPQSFSPPHKGKNKGQQKENVGEDKQNPVEKDGETSTLDLNSKALGSCSDHQEVEKNALSRDEKNTAEEGLLTIGLGHSKLKASRTGFKPYKRCSVEAKESRVMNTGSQGEEKGPKRVI